MPERTFDLLEEGAQAEVRQLSVELGWSLEHATKEYLRAGRSLAIQAQMEQMKRKAPLLSLVEHKKGLERAEKGGVDEALDP